MCCLVMHSPSHQHTVYHDTDSMTDQLITDDVTCLQSVCHKTKPCRKLSLHSSVYTELNEALTLFKASAHINMKRAPTLVWLQVRTGMERTGTAVSLLKMKLVSACHNGLSGTKPGVSASSWPKFN